VIIKKNSHIFLIKIGIYESFFMSLKSKSVGEFVGVCIFGFLLGIVVSLVLFCKDVNSIKEYVDMMDFQLDTISVSKSRIFIYVLFNRSALFLILFLVSILLRNRFISLYFLGGTFVLYGIFLYVNIIIFGVKGVISGFFLIIPQWVLYITSYLNLISINNGYKRIAVASHVIKELLCLLGVILGTLIESYVTLPLFIKIFFV